MLKLSVVLFFISLVFAYSSPAQTTEKNNVREESEKSETNFFEVSRKDIGFGKKTFAANLFDKAEKSSERPGSESAAQDETAPVNYKLRRGEKEIGVEFGLSPLQPTFLSGGKEYDTSGRKFGMLSLSWGRNIGTAKGVSVEYRIEIIPVALAFKNEVANPAFADEKTTPGVAPTLRKTTYGWGFSPIGFRFFFKPEKRLKPFISMDAGFMFFKKPVPVPGSTDYDFIGSVGAGLLYQVRRNNGITFGYRYFHISNMNIGEINPGYNANIFYIGYSFFYK